MREIKFRVFDKKKKEMIGVAAISFDESMFMPDNVDYNDFYNYDNEYYSDLMQSTGLFDKYGVEIYEGDIVRWGMNGLELSGVRYAEVIFSPSLEFKLLFYENEKTGQKNRPLRLVSFGFSNFIYTDTKKYLEVVGNIYENKELLQ